MADDLWGFKYKAEDELGTWSWDRIGWFESGIPRLD